ncbi:MAG TPA: hypothetical protein VGO57_15485 [Verrucomicrobiae bacterium]
MRTLSTSIILGLACLVLAGCQTPEERAMSRMEKQVKIQTEMMERMQKLMAEQQKAMDEMARKMSEGDQ